MPARRAQVRGISLVELMVGLVIGMIATAIIFQTFSVAESYKRNTTSAGDAQQNGLFSTFTLALELANAGNGFASAAQILANCPAVNDVATTWRPVPVVIEPGATADTPDAFTVFYSVSPTLVYPAPITLNVPKGATSIEVQSPNGFKVNDLAVAISPAKLCEPVTISAVGALSAAGGKRTLTVAAGTQNAYPACVPPNCLGGLLPLGPAGTVQRVRYDVVNGVLRSQDLMDPNAQPVPLASNIVNMKVEYGVDTDANGVLDTWVDAASAGFKPQDLLTGTIQQVNRVKAVRIGFIVRGAQYERALATAVPPNGDFDWVLFDCDTHDNTCPGRLTGTIAADANGGGYRYRVYETVVPLRNHLWNKQL